MSLLTSPEILRAENQFIALLDRTFQKASKTSTLDYKKELPRNVKRWFGSATFQKQLDNILTSIIVQSVLYADGQMKKLQAASLKESTILTQEAVRLSQDLGADVSKSIIRMLDEDAIYYEHPNALAGRIQDLWGGEKYRAVRFARTFTADVATASTVHRYRQYGVRYMEFDAELDDKTTDQCRALNGTIFDLEKDSIDQYRCPLHINCRSGLKPLADTDLNNDMVFENRDFSTALDDPDKVDRAFKNIDGFNEKYRVSKYVIDQDLATRVMLDKGMSVGLDVGIENIVRKEVVSKAVPEVVERGAFVPAKTVKEAEQRLKDKGITYIDMRGVPVEHANAFLEVIDNIPKDAVPDAFGSGSAFAKFTDRPLGRKPGSWYGVSIDFPSITVDGKTLVDKNVYHIVSINTRDYKTLDSIAEKKKAFNEAWMKNHGSKWSFNDERGILTHYHECGHVYDNKWRISSSKEWESLSKQWINEMDIKCDMLNKPNEAWAEAFADVYGNDGQKVPTYIKDYVKEKSGREMPAHIKNLKR